MLHIMQFYKNLQRRTAQFGRNWLLPAIFFVAVTLAACLPTVWHMAHSATQHISGSALPAKHGTVHSNIMTTVFWVGEAADAENDHISNVPSAWDDTWQTSYGGYDNPNKRSGYKPVGFDPLENPFYFALPYADLTEQGTRKPTASECLAYTTSTDDHYSWCKNTWIAVTYSGKTAYAQWEDVGPNEDDDATYVFGTARPKNTFGERAGLDVSPAVRDYLGLDGANRTSWTFVPPSSVPGGPWKERVTTSLGYRLDQAQ